MWKVRFLRRKLASWRRSLLPSVGRWLALRSSAQANKDCPHTQSESFPAPPQPLSTGSIHAASRSAEGEARGLRENRAAGYPTLDRGSRLLRPPYAARPGASAAGGYSCVAREGLGGVGSSRQARTCLPLSSPAAPSNP